MIWKLLVLGSVAGAAFLVLFATGAPAPASAQTEGPTVSLVEAIVDQVLRLFLNL